MKRVKEIFFTEMYVVKMNVAAMVGIATLAFWGLCAFAIQFIRVFF